MKSFALILIAALMAGCSSSGFQVYKAKPDQFHPGTDVYFSDPIKIHTASFLTTGYDDADFKLYYCTKSGTKPLWQFMTHVKRDIVFSWMFVNSVSLRIDTAVFTLHSEPTPTREVLSFASLNWCDESNFFDVEDSLLQRLATAKSAAIRVEGEKAYYDHSFDSTEIKNIAFSYDYLKNNRFATQQ